MTQRLEAAQKKQTAQEFVQRSYVASQLTALKTILSIKDADATGDLHLLKAPSIIKYQAMIKARSRQRHRLLVISGIAVQPYRYSSALYARGGRG